MTQTTYRGYVIEINEGEQSYLFHKGTTRVMQKAPIIPFPTETLEQSAQLHIDQLEEELGKVNSDQEELFALRQQVAQQQESIDALSIELAGILYPLG